MYKNIVYNHIIEHLGSIKLCNLTEDDCQRFINEYAGWSKTFASKVRMVLRRILTKAEKQELIKTMWQKTLFCQLFTKTSTDQSLMMNAE